MRRDAALAGVLAALAWAGACAAPARADELRGVVADSLGAPVPNCDFDVFDLEGVKLPASDNTDGGGAYRLTLDPGRYDVLVQPPIGSGFAPQMRRGVEIAGTTALDWTLAAAFRQVGRVLTSAGRPVLATRIEFDRLADGVRVPSLGNVSSPFGTFAAYVEYGAFSVTATPPESTQLAPARITPWTMPNADTLKFSLVFAAYLSGTVRDAGGAPVAGARLAFDRTDDGERVPSAENRTDGAGVFRARVAPGNYRLLVEAPSGTKLAAKRVANVDLAADATLDVTLETGVLVSGRVTDREGRAIAGADWDAADAFTGTSVPTPGDNTDADGRFALVLPPGRYRLTLSPPASSGLDTLVFDDVEVQQDRAFDYSYATGGAPAPPASLRLVPLGTPSHAVASLRLFLPEASPARIELFDASGRRVRVLHDGDLAAGVHDFRWDGRHANGATSHTGVYFARAIAGARHGTTRFVLLPY